MTESNKYEDIINLPHPTSRVHPRMSMHDRAGQFAPFASLSGYGGAIRETARLTEERIELTEDEQEALNRVLQEILSDGGFTEHDENGLPIAAVTHFVPDAKKAGGAYVTTVGSVKRIDEFGKALYFDDGRAVALSDILRIDPVAEG